MATLDEGTTRKEIRCEEENYKITVNKCNVLFLLLIYVLLNFR